MKNFNRIKRCGLFLLVMAGVSSVCAEPGNTVKACAECHGLEGRTQIPGWPPISDYSQAELESKLKAYRQGLVPESRMDSVAHQLSDEQIREVSEYFSSQHLAESQKSAGDE